MNETTHDVAVIGYGPVGVTAANLLGQMGLRVLVVERDADVYARARAHFSEKELVDLNFAVIAINAWNRVAIGFRAIHPVKAKAASSISLLRKPALPRTAQYVR